MRTLLATVLSIAIVTPALAQTTPFEPFRQDPFVDVPESHESYEVIESLRERNILRGYPDGTFKPDNRINRAEFVYLITNPLLLDTNEMNECLNEEGVANAETVFYPDVDRGAWYAKAVCHATRKGLIKGYPDGKFRPGEYINFVEAAKIISSAMALQTKEEPGEKWFTPYVDALSAENAIPANITTYGQMLTRVEMAEMLYRLKDDISDRPHTSASSLRY